MSSSQSKNETRDIGSKNLHTKESDGDNSIDDMLANVDQFIQGVYRDLSLSPPRHSSIRNPGKLSHTSDSPAGPSTLPAARSNMEAEIENINRFCTDVDQNLRSIGVYMDVASPGVSKTSLTYFPSPPTSSIIVNNNTKTTLSSMNGRTRHQNNNSADGLASESIIDLSHIQASTPEIYRQPVNLLNDDDNDDDVILVSANIPYVVDLSTPDNYQEIYRAEHSINRGHLSRRRIHDVSSLASDIEEVSSRKNHNTETSSTSSDDACMIVNEISPLANNEGCTPFMCPVCMDSCLQRQPTSTFCGHVFCKRCINRAIIHNHKCPICNKKLSRKEIFRIYL